MSRFAISTQSRALSLVAIVASIAALAVATISFLRPSPVAESVAFVRIDALLASYKGVQTVRSLMDESKAKWQRDLDTLQSGYRLTRSTLERGWKAMPTSERQRLEELAGIQQSNLERQTAVANERVQEQQEKLMGGIMNQINEVLAKYAGDRGLDIVLGVTGEGTVLYGSKALDITDDVAGLLNATYASADATLHRN